MADRERFKSEIHQQLERRIKKYMNLQKRQKSDFVKPRSDEQLSYDMQIHSHNESIDGLETEVA